VNDVRIAARVFWRQVAQSVLAQPFELRGTSWSIDGKFVDGVATDVAYHDMVDLSAIPTFVLSQKVGETNTLRGPQQLVAAHLSNPPLPATFAGKGISITEEDAEPGLLVTTGNEERIAELR